MNLDAETYLQLGLRNPWCELVWDLSIRVDTKRQGDRVRMASLRGSAVVRGREAEYHRAYAATESGAAVKRKAVEKYRQSEKGRATKARLNRAYRARRKARQS